MADAMDYETMSRADLTKLRGNIDRAISSTGDRDKRAALKAAEDAVREHGFTLAELVPLMGGAAGSGRGKGRRASGGAPKAASDVRFRNPEDHAQTWSGRGRRPAWYNEAQAAGRVIEDLKAS